MNVLGRWRIAVDSLTVDLYGDFWQGYWWRVRVTLEVCIDRGYNQRVLERLREPSGVELRVRLERPRPSDPEHVRNRPKYEQPSAGRLV